jgi:hypothetical protein
MLTASLLTVLVALVPFVGGWDFAFEAGRGMLVMQET